MDRSGQNALRFLTLRLLLGRPALVLLGLSCASAFVQNAAAQAEPPLRVAIVGLVHGHVEGFLGQLPKHPGGAACWHRRARCGLAGKVPREVRAA